MMSRQVELTDEQKNAYELNDADFAYLEERIRSVSETAAARLVSAGRFTEPPVSTECLRCTCTEFKSKPHHLHECARCPHSRTSHNGFL
ncbi:hypothetical protein ACWGH3_14185 [Streptomyces sp. NPDC054884]|uniref:hypothetical protein n=1 Tax=Streptomyces sp. ME08-AFT2 TaxID=3028683 RepID=UPI0029A55C06|nr:hypothetical protein [Streptomyces sp. ME08-AFT2]MDX3311196.1 hypothetical protein [Streptomyces sp. ME08-AFT2]